MPFYKRGFLYLIRKRAKTLLLLLVFLLVNSMILGTNMILHAAQNTEAAMQEKAGAKVVCEISDTADALTDTQAQHIKNIEGVTSINRMGQHCAYAADLVPVTANPSKEPDNRKVNLLSYDDMETDGAFADQSYRLTDGNWIRPDTQYSAVINKDFADTNGLGLGDKIAFKTETGNTVTVEVIGEYLTGKESRQEASAFAVDRIENQIYIDNVSYLELFGDSSFYKIVAYTGQPELLDAQAESIREILGDKADITTSDALYQQMKAPLMQMIRVVVLMRLLTFISGTAVISLLLCMWMRSRQKEMAVLISMGESKNVIFLQALLETAVVFFIALLGSCAAGFFASGSLAKLLTASADTGVSWRISLQFTDIAQLFGIGGAVAVIAVGLSLFPVIRANPKDILSRMEG